MPRCHGPSKVSREFGRYCTRITLQTSAYNLRDALLVQRAGLWFGHGRIVTYAVVCITTRLCVGQAKWSTGPVSQATGRNLSYAPLQGCPLQRLCRQPSRRSYRLSTLVADSVIYYVVISSAMLRIMVNPPATLESTSATSELASSSTSCWPAGRPVT